jgi:predicted component of type VI protein secretion system
MIEMDVATRRKPIVAVDDPSSNYLVLGDFGSSSAVPIAIDRHNFDEALNRMDVRVGATRFHRLDDFHPDRLCQRVPLLRELEPASAEAHEEKPADLPTPNLEELLLSSSLLEQITEGIDPFQQYIRELTRVYSTPASAEQSEESARDAALSERLRAVLHHPQFQSIESAWRGADFLVRSANSSSSGSPRVYLAQYSRDDANRDLLNGASRADGRLQELLHSRRWRAIAGLYQFGPDASDIELLGRLAQLAAQVRAPFVSGCSLAEGAADMGPYWSELTAIPEADHLGLVLPRFMLRLPYGASTAPIDSFAFEEMPNTPVHNRYLWGNPALACLSLLARGGENLDLTGLPVPSRQQEGAVTTAPLVEVKITEVQELALIEAGLMPLVPSPQSDCARLAGFRAITGTDLPLA